MNPPVLADHLLRGQRTRSLAGDQCALCGLQMYAQIFVGLALYVYDHVSAPGYLSLLLTAPYLLTVLLWARRLARFAPADGGLMDLATGGTRRALSLLLFLSAMLDGALLFHGLCAVALDVMTDLSPWAVGLAVAGFAALSLWQRGDHALSRLAHALQWLILALLLYCAGAALPHGKSAHFFPILGYGAERIGAGALWLCGAVSGCAWPLLYPEKPCGALALTERRSTLLRPALLALLAGVGTMLCSVWLMPVYALARPYTLGWRMLLLTHMTPSVAAWSLEFAGVTLLLMLTLCHSLCRAGEMLAMAGGRKEAPAFLPALLIAPLLPLRGAGEWAAAEALIRFAPWRAVILIAVLGCLTLASRRNAKKAGPGKGAAA